MKNNTRTRKNNRKLLGKVARMSQEIKLLRRIANTMNRHFSLDYNGWAKSTPKHLKLMDAAALLKEYFEEHPFTTDTNRH